MFIKCLYVLYVYPKITKKYTLRSSLSHGPSSLSVAEKMKWRARPPERRAGRAKYQHSRLFWQRYKNTFIFTKLWFYDPSHNYLLSIGLTLCYLVTFQVKEPNLYMRTFISTFKTLFYTAGDWTQDLLHNRQHPTLVYHKPFNML